MPRLHQKKFHRNRKFDYFIDRALDPCLKCGSIFARTGRRFTISCVEGRIVPFRICRACANLPVEQSVEQLEIRRAA
jgi:hypothetical protein